MKIFFYINILAGGGAERVVANLASAFADAGHRVSIVTTYRVEHEYDTDCRVKRYELESGQEKGGFVSRNFHRVAGLRRLMKTNKPDILISFMAEPNFRAIIASAFLPVKTVISVRNDPHAEYGSKLKWKLANLLFKRAAGAVFQTPDAKACFDARIRKRSVVIPNMVNPIFYTVNRKEVCRDIVSVGRLTEQKNQKMLIEAFAEIKDQTEDNLLLYGEGELRSELEEVIRRKGLKDRVFLCGNVSKIEEILAAAKLFVLSSDYEGMPNALMEAMAAGVPCIATDCPCGGPKMLIDNGKSGLLTPVKEKSLLSEAMLLLLKDEALARQLGSNGRKEAKKYAPQFIYKKWLDYIQTLVPVKKE